ncbi:DUF1273 domain-containing protein [Lactococcus cremoris]|uniref:UPF0398 protein LL1196_0599 n=2 Tax=Lactococcus lactis subsp. cremoris TaxID=1359 RepID=A0A896T8F6_LACLC|nr:DUF1273 domain-containing protein [Lactococcus cremoris]EQC87516.1 hypothetical protein LLT7_13815 [Lactococcus cremoris subsp. cremoris TIFN7]MDU1524942.1 DUF1273 domain-containing protein [Lactococcus lactis]MCT0498595.1 DUF1273 domain-containing protein [Lactococcus cremoris]MCT4399957.1 DUF1273 domain-containing protein [Lactococcus cremoris]MCT4428913.1 DUF1273 domain-containing protein [Lactococcus cremoris]
MNSLLIMGYTSFDLGIFNEKDIKVSIIKKTIRRKLINFLEEGLRWVIFTGNLGFEYWALEVAKELQTDYEFQIGTIFPFETHGQNWNENNQIKLASFKQVDFVKYAFEAYENPGQFRQYNEFLLENTEGSFVFYDEENETKLKNMVEKMKQSSNYEVYLLNFEDLQETFEEMND